MFTVEQIEEISRKLNASARRDCDLPAAHALTGGEFVPLVQDAENRNATLMQIATVIYDIVVREFREDLWKVYLNGNVLMMWTIDGALTNLCLSIARVALLVDSFCDAADRLGDRAGLLDGLLDNLSDAIDRLFTKKQVDFGIEVSLEDEQVEFGIEVELED
ncbi:MAG: hypothetical protein LUD72_12955 [Bacteroidales bacterium]|nr:hypothetical protein [Bacteroidales bacterium]